MLKKLPVQLLISIFLACVVGHYASLEVTRAFFTISCALKDMLMQVLPLVIFSYIASAILSLEQRGPVLILSILVLVCVSIIFAVFTSYGVAAIVFPFLHGDHVVNLSVPQESVTSYFNLPSGWVAPDKAMFVGVVVGLFFGIKRQEKVTTFVLSLRNGVTTLLNKTFIPLLPFYVFGFVLKIQFEGNLAALAVNYGQTFVLTCLLIIAYISFLYFAAASFNIKRFMNYAKNMLPAGLTGFSTMSSAATMPVTLAATEENLKDAQFADLVIPLTVNNHMLGDCLGIPLLGLSVLALSGVPFPDIASYSLFALYFCGAKFSTAGVPGGGVLVLLPVLQSHLGLSSEMTGLVATLYILQDSIFTSSNVMGNGAFALLSHRLLTALRLVKTAPSDDQLPVAQSQG